MIHSKSKGYENKKKRKIVNYFYDFSFRNNSIQYDFIRIDIILGI